MIVLWLALTSIVSREHLVHNDAAVNLQSAQHCKHPVLHHA